MTDLDRLRNRTWSAPPAGVLEAVTAVGRRRRWRLASGTSIMAAAAVLLALQVVPGPNSRDSLVPARTPQLTDVPVTPEPEKEDASPADALDAPSTNGDRGGSTALGGATAVREGAASADRPTMLAGRAQPEAREFAPPVADDRPADKAGRSDAYAPLVKYRGQEPSVRNCAPRNPRVSACGFDEDADVGVPADGRRQVGFHACQDPDEADARVLRFASEAEVVLTIKDDNGQAVWGWRPPRPYRSVPHQEQIATGECLFWTTSWREVADDGRPLPSGVYKLHVDFLGDKSDFVHTNTFTVVR